MASDAVDANERRKVVLSVFWCGTDGDKDVTTTQIQLFGQFCDAEDISEVEGPLPWDDEATEDLHLMIRVDGCYKTNGFLGLIFGAGLDAQSKWIYTKVMELINDRGARVVLNLFGLSRGGVGCLKLIKRFKAVTEHLEINVLAYDPVPGNFVTTAKMDFCRVTHAWANMDLRSVARVKDALVLYPYEPLPTLAVHAPMVPLFRDGVCTYEVIFGCHQGAMWNMGTTGLAGMGTDIWISAELVKNFLASHGTRLNATTEYWYPQDDFKLLERLTDEQTSTLKSKRTTHSKGSIEILRIPGRAHVNRFHYILSQMITDVRDNDSRLLPWRQRPYYYATPIPADTEFSLCLSAEP